MATMGRYCKAYTIERLRQFTGWTENSQNVRKETKEIDGNEVEVKRVLTGDDYLFLQENFIVTDGIFQDENIIFDGVTQEWIEFCQRDLEFAVPEDELAGVA